MEPPGRCGDGSAPPPSPPRAHAPGRHDERGVGTFIWPPAGTYTWPSTRTFPWPWTGLVPVDTSARDGYMPSAGPASLEAHASVLGVVAGPTLTMSVQARRSADGDQARTSKRHQISHS